MTTVNNQPGSRPAPGTPARAVAGRQFLAEAEHPNIVRIVDLAGLADDVRPRTFS